MWHNSINVERVGTRPQLDQKCLKWQQRAKKKKKKQGRPVNEATVDSNKLHINLQVLVFWTQKAGVIKKLPSIQMQDVAGMAWAKNTENLPTVSRKSLTSRKRVTTPASMRHKLSPLPCIVVTTEEPPLLRRRRWTTVGHL